jgi:hypothetical protein
LVVERQTAPVQKDLTPPPDRERTMLFLSACFLALKACASVSKTATPTVTAVSPLV